jgi:parallel beta-helix repeat protein
MKKISMLGVGILIFFSLFPVTSYFARSEELPFPTLYVGGSGPGNYTKIQDALDTITSGGTVYVFPGTYHEQLIISTPVHLIGKNNQSTIIDGDAEQFVVTLAAGNSTLSSFTVINSQKKFPYAGIYIISDNNTISDNILTDNYYGMQLGYASSHNLIVHNMIYNNGRCGIYFNHASYNRLIHNVVVNNPVNGFGLYEFSNNNTILNNTFSGNRDTGVNIRESYNNQVIGNTFNEDHVGLHTPSPEYHTVVQDNIFSDNAVPLDEERDAMVCTVVLFDFFVLIVFLVFKRLVR